MVQDAGAQGVGVLVAAPHGAGGVADVDALEDAGQLPVREGQVEGQVGEVPSRAGGITTGQLRRAGKAGQLGGGLRQYISTVPTSASGSPSVHSSQSSTAAIRPSADRTVLSRR